uniref:Uncharacterized protein n=1 Tax=Physcomitrium patens TaxID=3218 RepID=A0A2K1KWP1_PHYPA|nr:hypothetical protein PHYPA_005199 [Physcomitrium patens]
MHHKRNNPTPAPFHLRLVCRPLVEEANSFKVARVLVNNSSFPCHFATVHTEGALK